MSYMWVSVADCDQSQIFQLTQMLKQDKDLQIVLSYDLPVPEIRMASEDDSGRRTERLLVKLGMPSHLKGYHYLKTAFKICMKEDHGVESVTKILYPEIAKKHATSPEKVEHAIRHAIESAWKRGDEKMQRTLFGYGQNEGRRPTNSAFIAGITDYLQHNNTTFLS